MKSKYSITAFILIGIISISIRIDYAQKEAQQKQFCLTTYNAFGYYMYLPSALIYQDMRQLTWLPTIDRQYSVTGGSLYQAIKEKNGHHVF